MDFWLLLKFEDRNFEKIDGNTHSPQPPVLPTVIGAADGTANEIPVNRKLDGKVQGSPMNDHCGAISVA